MGGKKSAKLFESAWSATCSSGNLQQLLGARRQERLQSVKLESESGQVTQASTTPQALDVNPGTDGPPAPLASTEAPTTTDTSKKAPTIPETSAQAPTTPQTSSQAPTIPETSNQAPRSNQAPTPQTSNQAEGDTPKLGRGKGRSKSTVSGVVVPPDPLGKSSSKGSPAQQRGRVCASLDASS